jgi:hypothetical protein
MHSVRDAEPNQLACTDITRKVEYGNVYVMQTANNQSENLVQILSEF